MLIKRPVFLVGAERSGTTLLRLIISNHPRIAFAGEFEFVVDWIAPDGSFPTRAALVAQLERDRVFQLKQLAIPNEPEFLTLANDFLDQIRRLKPAALVTGATVHRHFDRLLQIWPDARFIHLVRDGRDVALSTIPMGWHGNIYSGIERWCQAEALWARFVAGLTPDRHITLHYEQLVSDTEAELTRICQFMGVEYDAAMLDFHKVSTYEPIRAGGSGKWRKLRPEVVAAAEARAAVWLEANGYALSQPVRPASRGRRLYYNAQDRWAKIRFSQKRYSLRLWLEGVIARRVGTQAWRDKVNQRMNAITNKHLK